MPIGTGNEDLIGGVQRHWPLRVGDRVTHPEYRDEGPRLLAWEDWNNALDQEGNERDLYFAYQDPPIIGTVQHVTPDSSGLPGSYGHVNFPGVGVRILGVDELTRVEV